jgi:hypothetical protein
LHVLINESDAALPHAGETSLDDGLVLLDRPFTPLVDQQRKGQSGARAIGRPACC